MGNIFSPRKGKPIIDKKSGEIVGYTDYVSPGSGPFDQYYVDRELVEVCKPKEGGTEEDFVISHKVKETRRKIQEVLDSQADDVGLDNLLKKYQLTGDPSVLPSPVTETKDILDLTSFPQDSAEYMDYIQNLNKAYYSLPEDLREKMNPSEFIERVTPEQLNSYINNLKAKEVVKTQEKGQEPKKDGDK